MDAAELTQVIARARSRDATAFEALVRVYGTRLYGYFYRLTGSRDDADDLLQEVFVRLVRMIGEYEHDGRFDAWIFRIAANLVRDRVRRARTRRTDAARDVDGPEPLATLPDRSGSDPGDRLEREEDVDRLQLALGKLPEAEREVIILRHFSGLTFREIAELMQTPLGTALARAHRGLARLRELMGEPQPQGRAADSSRGMLT